MSAMLTLRCNNRRKKIFIWYDFKQIRDAVLLLFFSDKTNHFEKIFIYANPGKVGNRCTAVLYQRRDIWSRFAKNCNIFQSIAKRQRILKRSPLKKRSKIMQRFQLAWKTDLIRAHNSPGQAARVIILKLMISYAGFLIRYDVLFRYV